MAANKLTDSFLIYTGPGTIKVSDYDLENQVDLKSSCFFYIGSTGYGLSSVARTTGGVVTLTFSAGDVVMQEDQDSETGLIEIDASDALSGEGVGTFARLLFWDGYDFREFQFLT